MLDGQEFVQPRFNPQWGTVFRTNTANSVAAASPVSPSHPQCWCLNTTSVKPLTNVRFAPEHIRPPCASFGWVQDLEHAAEVRWQQKETPHGGAGLL